MREDTFALAYRLLDADLIDSDGRRCGRVDDIEIEGEPGSPAHVAAVLSGPAAFSRRIPRSLRPAASRLFGKVLVRVPWDAVDDLDTVLHLKRPGEELGLASGEAAAARLVERLPGSEK
jgi:sporulation protein YlmC with PRC-barrel domain